MRRILLPLIAALVMGLQIIHTLFLHSLSSHSATREGAEQRLRAVPAAATAPAAATRWPGEGTRGSLPPGPGRPRPTDASALTPTPGVNRQPARTSPPPDTRPDTPSRTGPADTTAAQPPSPLPPDWPALACCLLALCACAAFLLVQRRATPHRLAPLSDTVRLLAAGHLHVRASTDHRAPHVAELAARINHLAESVECAAHRERTFHHDVAHQLRNPMTALRLRLENLGTHLAPGGAETYDQVLKDIDRLDRTLTTMVEHFQRLPPTPGPHLADVRADVEEALRGWSVVARRRAVRLRLESPRRVCAVARPGTVEQVMDIVLDNALRYAPPSSTVRVVVRAHDAEVRVHVRDEGPGIPASERRSAMERGWHRSPAEGSGLGLSIAAELLTASGGRLELCSHEGGGLDAVLHLRGVRPTVCTGPVAA